MYAQVILPVPVDKYFSYTIPDSLSEFVDKGKRVVVPFGKRRLLAGIVRRVTKEFPQGTVPKDLLDVLDDLPIVDECHFKFWEWIAEYYLCSVGEVMCAALPASFRLESETSILIHPEFNGDMSNLSDLEYLIVEALQYSSSLTIRQISEIVDRQKVINIIVGLIDKKVVVSSEKITQTFKPKTVAMIRLNPYYHDHDNIRKLLDELEKRAFKQLELMMAFLRLGFEYPEKITISRQEILKQSNSTPSILKALIDKDVFEVFYVEVSRLGSFAAHKDARDIKLSSEQLKTFQLIKDGFKVNKPVLLHGITGSGKTEIYIRLIEEVILRKKQVLYMLPEIALTSHIINRLREYFGNKVQMFHSRFSDQQRTELWNRITKFSEKDDDTYVILGPRSSVFLPLKEPGLIIVDEEHDQAFKQFDPAPRYHGRDAAVMLGKILNIPVLLGSATPSIESYYNARKGKYSLVELNKRFGKSLLPEILIANIAKANKEKKLKSHYTPLLLQHIKNALQNNKQIILFQNRRGFSLRLFCTTCGWHPGCPYCDVTLTYHKFINKLKCHYCGYMRNIPGHCDECDSSEIKTAGFGTEKIEEEMACFFPEAKVQRMDFDTTRTKNSYVKIIDDFEKRNTDILVGTQMISKGMDFSNVSVVGILNADSLISFPDFRSFERSFQHIVQVSGRAGRKEERGVVVIQTYNPSHDVIIMVNENNYKGMYQMQTSERERYKYPPFIRLVRIVCKSRDNKMVNNASNVLANHLRRGFGQALLGPEYPLVSKIKNEYIRHILIKLKPDKKLENNKKWIKNVITSLNEKKLLPKTKIIIEVDPY